jgi:hypothetical protein
MYIYTGKVNFSKYAKNEPFILVFAEGVDFGEPTAVYWQWTIDAQGSHNFNKESIGCVNFSNRNSDGTNLGLSHGQMYFFAVDLNTDLQSGSAIMSDGSTKSDPIELTLSFSTK